MNLIPQGTTPSLRRCILAALMRIANRNGHPQWYAWKTRLLEHYADLEDYDLITAKATLEPFLPIPETTSLQS